MHLLLLLLSALCADAIDLEFRVKENVGINTEVGNIRKRLRDTGIQFGSRQRFLILEEEQIMDLFKVKRRSGLIRTNALIDREKLCEQKPSCKVNFLVRVSNSTLPSNLVKVFVVIDDENDNAPEFRHKKTVVRVPEASNPDIPSAQPIPLPTAIDKDTDRFAVKQYKLEQDEKSKQYLTLVVDKPSPGVLRPRLAMRKALDREAHSRFTFHLVAVDGGGKKGRIEVVVEVTDINDNPPRWRTKPIRAQIRECAPRNSVLTTLEAVDRDVGANGRLEYAISEFASVEIQRSFYIQDQTLHLAHGLDYEKEKFIKIPVEARDGGGLTAEATVQLRVLDCNDNKPVISIVEEDGGRSILENDSKQHRLATVVVRDKDTGANGDVTCSLEKDVMDKFILFPTFDDPKTYEVRNAPQAQFDRETEAKVSVRVNCKDNGKPSNAVSKEFYVTVLDRNDNAPKFEQNPFRFAIPENRDYNTYVGTVRATDMDIGNNARLSYFLDKEGGKLFRINKLGELHTLTRFDREEKASYSFKVFARDAGERPLTSSVMVHVSILDVNDCRPRFNRSVYIFNVVESNGQRTTHRYLGHLVATDKDLGSNGTVNFRLSSTSDILKSKVTVTKTGFLSIEGIIDRETQQDFNFDVVAYDDGDPPLSSSAMIKVNVLDINDNAPKFTYPSSSGTVTNISKPTPVGSTVTTISATDPDNGINGTIRYSIQRSGRDNLFKLDDTTGTLILLRSIEKEGHRGPWRLTLKATDGGGISSLTTLLIRLVNSRSSRGHPPYTDRGVPVDDNANMTILYALAAIVFAVFIILFVVLVLFYLRCCNCRKGPRKEGGEAEAHHYDAVNVTSQENQYQERQGKETLPLDATLLPRDTACQKVTDEYQNEDNGYTNLHTGQRVRSTSYGYIPVNMNEEGFYGTRTMRRNPGPRPSDPDAVAATAGSYEAFNLVTGGPDGLTRDAGQETVKRHGQPISVDSSGTGKLVSTHSYTRLESPSKTAHRGDKAPIEPSPFTSLKSPYITTSFV